MSKTDIKQAKFETRKLSELTNWENNPRSILTEDFDRLKGQIARLGVYKTLLVNQDNIVLGGNMRLRAFKELFGDDYEVLCGIVETKDQGEMLEYALSDNDNAGTTDDLKLAEVFALQPIEMELYKIQSNVLRPLSHIINPPDPASGDDDQSVNDKTANSSANKQIVLYYDDAQYEKILVLLEALGSDMGLKNHTEIITKLIKDKHDGIIT